MDRSGKFRDALLQYANRWWATELQRAPSQDVVLHLLDHGSTTTTQGDGTTVRTPFHETLFVPMTRRDADEIAHGEYGHELHGGFGERPQLTFDQQKFQVEIQPNFLPLSKSGDIQLAIRDTGDGKEAVVFLDVFGCSDSDRFDRARDLVGLVMQDYIEGGPKANAEKAKTPSSDEKIGDDEAADELQVEKPPIFWYQVSI